MCIPSQTWMTTCHGTHKVLTNPLQVLFEVHTENCFKVFGITKWLEFPDGGAWIRCPETLVEEIHQLSCELYQQ